MGMMPRFASMTGEWYARERTAWWLVLLFAVLIGLVSFPNHYLLRTHAMDLGLYTHALWQYAHGTVHDSSLFLEDQQPVLADHFDLYLLLFAPLAFVFGSWTLLVVQWVSMLVGAWGVRKLLLAMGVGAGLALVGMTVFFLFFGLYAAASYDYHSNVVASMVLPWFLLAALRGKTLATFLLLVLMLVAKENMGFWLGVVAWVLCSFREIPQRMRWPLFFMGFFAFAWSFVLLGWVMPALSHDARYMHFDYSILGESVGDVPASLIDHPWGILKAFFMDHYGHHQGTEIKLEFWAMLLLSGGWALLLVPRYGLMMLPVLAQKMLHDHEGKWSAGAQYSIEFAPLVAVAVVLVLSRVADVRWRTGLSVIGVLAALATVVRFMDNTYVPQNIARIRFYQLRHYTRHYDVGAARSVLASVPSTARVSAQTSALPHVALSERVYLFPIVRDAEHIILLPSDETYPLNREQWIEKVEALRQDSTWQVIEDSPAVLHFVKRPR